MADYKDCLELAGAEVLAYETFGSYQGDWWAKVKFNDREGFVHGYYGSCSGCDTLEAALRGGHDHGDDYVFYFEEYVQHPECPTCCERVEAARNIGKDYLDDIIEFESAIAKAKENEDWDMDAKAMVNWLEANE